MSAHKAAQTASVHAKKATATYDMVEGGLTGCLQQFQKSLRAVAAFLDVLAHEVDGIHQNTLRAQVLPYFPLHCQNTSVSKLRYTGSHWLCRADFDLLC